MLILLQKLLYNWSYGQQSRLTDNNSSVLKIITGNLVKQLISWVIFVKSLMSSRNRKCDLHVSDNNKVRFLWYPGVEVKSTSFSQLGDLENLVTTIEMSPSCKVSEM